jgi:hypothetical protein
MGSIRSAAWPSQSSGRAAAGRGRRKDCVRGARRARGLLPDAAGVGEHEMGAVHEQQEVEVAERLGEQEAQLCRAVSQA